MSTPADSPIYDSETLVRRVIDMIATARTIPLSSSPVINRDEVLELLEEAVDRLPEELRRARWMLKERDEFIAKTRRQAEDILDEARAHAERMVQRTEVVRAAELRARQIVEAAENESRRMKMEVEDFCDQRLGSFEIVLDRLQRTVAAGREKLNLGARLEEEQELAEPDNGNPAFFDQDRS
jgi:cell division septum initiation protein DivIVA